MFRHCDFGHIAPDNEKGSMLLIDTLVQPNRVGDGGWPNVIDPGKYQFELLLSGDNVKIVRKRWEIEFREWSEIEADMLNRCVKLEEIG